MATLFVDKIDPQSGTTLEIGSSGDTITTATGAKPSFLYPAFEAYLSSDQTVSDSVDTKIQLDTELFVTNNNFDNSTNYRFTPTVAGKYFAFGQVTGDSTGADSVARVITMIFKNGAKVSHTQIFGSVTNYSNIFAPYTSIIVDMNGSTDYLELFGLVDSSSGTPAVDGGSFARTYFGAYRIGT